jgi:Arc/MetJ-type ribon-helix-helix transcriptional regulator
MKYERLEIRLDPEHQHKVAELREEYKTTASEVVRRGIDALYEEWRAQQRKEAINFILGFEGVDDVPDDPEELKRQNESLYDFGDLD